jgi:hypothetical protein
MNIRVAQAGLAVKEVASYEHPRIHGVSNLNALSDGWRILRTILVERYQARSRKAPATDTITTGHYTDLKPALYPLADLTNSKTQ